MTLNEARAALEQYAEGEVGNQPLERCAALLHTARGVLQMTETWGASLLAEEMEQTCRHLHEDAAGRPDRRRHRGVVTGRGAAARLRRAHPGRRPRRAAGAAAAAERSAGSPGPAAALRKYAAAAEYCPGRDGRASAGWPAPECAGAGEARAPPKIPLHWPRSSGRAFSWPCSAGSAARRGADSLARLQDVVEPA